MSLLFNQKKLDSKDRLERPKGRVKAAAAATAEPSRPPAASRRPQRAAAACSKSYKDPDTDDSQSESEELPVSKAKKTSLCFMSLSLLLFYKNLNCLFTFETILNKFLLFLL